VIVVVVGLVLETKYLAVVWLEVAVGVWEAGDQEELWCFAVEKGGQEWKDQNTKKG